jgi:phosphatidylserine decarboxylase
VAGVRIKGKNFTLANLFQDEALANSLDGGSIAVFRLAPQDYHRFHAPARGSVQSISNIDGTYFTGKNSYQEKKKKSSPEKRLIFFV